MKKTLNKKLYLIAILSLLMLLPFLLAGCGEQFIEERDYQLVRMQVIIDKTPSLVGNSYEGFKAGEVVDYICGKMTLNKMNVNITTERLTLVFDDTKASGFKAVYYLDKYTADDVYPAYKFSKSYQITYKGVDVINYNESDLATLSQQDQDLYGDIAYITNMFTTAETSIQIITQNQSLMAHIMFKNKTNGELVFMGTLYGY